MFQLPVCLALWALSPATKSPDNALKHITSTSPPAIVALVLFSFLSLSRLGLWIFDLTTQQLTQTMVAPSHRSAFAGVENSFVSFFELGNYVTAMILSRPSEFKYLATGSLAAVALSTLVYAGWVWKMRGHLVHWERLGKGCKCISGQR
jgi:iron-regulated transporter 1